MTAADVHPHAFGARYEVRGELGRGAMGVVYDVYDHDLNHPLALKALHRVDPDERRALKHEFRLQRLVRHDNVVGLHALHEDDGRIWFTMERVDGGPFVTALRARLAAGDEAGARALVRDAAAGIDAVHQTGAVHRDVKPSNLLVRADGTAVVLDFGLADTRRRLALARDASGTLDYLAPEAAWGGAVPASDWFGLGAVLLEALAGRLPWTPDRFVRGGPPREAIRGTLPASAPGWLVELALDLVTPDPAHRPDFDAIRARLGEPADGPPRGWGFVGRTRELAALGAALDRVTASGRTEIVALEGEPGVGKSRLLDAFVSGLARPDVVLLAGRCHHTERIPYRAMDPILDDLDLHARVRSVAGGAWEALHARMHPPAPEAGELPSVTRRAWVGALADALVALGDASVVVLLLDDLQWGDTDGVELLADLLARDPRCLVVLCGRPDWQTPELTAPLDELPAWAVRATIRVEPLPPADAAALASQVLGDVSPDEVDAAVAAARGLPFLLERRAFGGDPTELPDHRRDLLRMLALDPEPLPRLVALDACADDRDGLLTLHDLERRGLVRLLAGEDRVAVYHDLLRAEILDGVTPDVRRSLHDRVAASVEAVAPGDLGRRFHHLAGAGRGPEAGQVAVAAADVARAELAFVREATWLGRAAELTPDDAGRLALFERQADAWGDSGRLSAAGDALLAAVAVARALALPTERIDALRTGAARALVSAGRIDEGEALFADLLRARGFPYPRHTVGALLVGMWHRVKTNLLGLREPVALPDDQSARLELLALAAGGLTMSRMHTGFALSGLMYALSMRGGSARHQAYSISAEAPFQAGLGGMWEKRSLLLLDRLKRLNREHDLPEEFNTEQTEGTVAWHLGQWRRAADTCEAAARILRAHAMHDASRLTIVETFGCSARCWLGDFDRLGDAADVALQAALDRGDRVARVMLDAGDPGMRYFVRGDAEGGDALARRIWELVPADAGVFEYAAATHEARAHLYAGRFDEGVEALTRVIPRLEKNQALAMRCVRTIVFDLLARLLLGVGRARGLDAVRRPLAKATGKVRGAGLPVSAAFATRLDAATARLAGDEARAVAGYRDAVAAFDGVEMALLAWAARVAAGEPVPAPGFVGDAPALLGMLDPVAAA